MRVFSFVAVLAAACGGVAQLPDAGTPCDAGTVMSCSGNGGCLGQQTCRSDGASFSACFCAPDDGGLVDVTADDVSIDASVAVAPNQISGLVLWLDSSFGVVADGSFPTLVSQWNDRSTAGNGAVDTAYQQEPTAVKLGYKTFDVLQFPAGGGNGNKLMSIADSVSLQFGTSPFALAFVFRIPKNQANTATMWTKGSGLSVSVSNIFTAGAGSASVSALLPNPTSVHVVVVRGPSLELRIDGAATSGGIITSDIGAAQFPVQLGAIASAPNDPITIDYLAVLAYKGQVSDPDVKGVEAYLREKYGL